MQKSSFPIHMYNKLSLMVTVCYFSMAVNLLVVEYRYVYIVYIRRVRPIVNRTQENQ